MDMKTILDRMKQRKQPQPNPELQKLIDRMKQRKAEQDAEKNDKPTT